MLRDQKPQDLRGLFGILRTKIRQSQIVVRVVGLREDLPDLLHKRNGGSVFPIESQQRGGLRETRILRFEKSFQFSGGKPGLVPALEQELTFQKTNQRRYVRWIGLVRLFEVGKSLGRPLLHQSNETQVITCGLIRWVKLERLVKGVAGFCETLLLEVHQSQVALSAIILRLERNGPQKMSFGLVEPRLGCGCQSEQNLCIRERRVNFQGFHCGGSRLFPLLFLEILPGLLKPALRLAGGSCGSGRLQKHRNCEQEGKELHDAPGGLCIFASWWQKSLAPDSPRRHERAKERQALYWLRRRAEGIIQMILRERLEFRL